MNHLPHPQKEDDIRLHLARLNRAAHESDIYVREAYIQRHGYRWFRDACERERQETRWFVEQGVEVVFLPTHDYEVRRKDGTQQ